MVIPGPVAGRNPESVWKVSETDSGFDPSSRPGMTMSCHTRSTACTRAESSKTELGWEWRSDKFVWNEFGRL